MLRADVMKDVCAGRRDVASPANDDHELRIEQKGVDMRIGIDIAHLAYKRLVDQMILVSGDSDFVPVAKLVRREGLDFILDPMGAHTAADLREHVDGVKSHTQSYKPPCFHFPFCEKFYWPPLTTMAEYEITYASLLGGLGQFITAKSF